MNDLFTVLGLMSPCVAALAISRFATSRIAKRILIVGGLYFLIVILLAYMFGQQCVGGLIEGFSSCQPAFLAPVAQTLASPLLISFFGYLVVGPGVLLAAAIFEFLKRRAS
jgi:hypothetical protein